MDIRETLNQRKTVVVCGTLVVFCCAAGLCYYTTMRPPSAPAVAKYQWFYDLGAQKLFVVRETEVPPIDAPISHQKAPDGGPGAVRAHVFTCGKCDQESGCFIGFLETYTPDVRSVLVSLNDPNAKVPDVPGGIPTLMLEGRSVALPDGGAWIPASSPDADKIMKQVVSKCADNPEALTECSPSGP